LIKAFFIHYFCDRIVCQSFDDQPTLKLCLEISQQNNSNNTRRKSSEDAFMQEVLSDFWICCVSREASLLGRKEVLSGKAKFGILGDGKEVPQVALARFFQKGDWRSGYYRDQTWMFATGISTVEDYFAQLYADTENDPFSGGRQMNCHWATPLIDQKGNWLSQDDRYNVSADISPTGGQMARASRTRPRHHHGIVEIVTWEGKLQMSQDGNEVCFVTIGDASTSEGVFWEALNAAAVIKSPMALSVWDDGYGISVPTCTANYETKYIPFAGRISY
jgi:TPP-dependent pyruvate/acetoin dehydrogenase alpha subunit